MNIYESGEDYLGTILMLKEGKGNVRSIDIVHEISFEKPSVSHALKQFQENGYITVDEDGFIYGDVTVLLKTLSDSAVMQNMWDGYRKQFVYAQDITYAMVIAVLSDILS